MKTIFTILTTLFFFTTLHAQIFVNHNATGNNDGTSWANAYSNLQDAFDNATASDQLWVAEGIYLPSNHTSPDSNWYQINSDIQIFGGFLGSETMLSQRVPEINLTILSGDINGDDVDDDFENFRSDNARHVLWIKAGQIELDGVIISNGQTRVDGIPAGTTDISPWTGGGMLVETATAIIRNCIFQQCNGNRGSALLAFSNTTGDNEILISHSLFRNNNSLEGTVRFSGMNSPVVENSFFTNNKASNFGGGITMGNTNALVEGCTFSGNEVAEVTFGAGGGIFIFQNAENLLDIPVVEIRNCNFEDNIGFAGGGVCFYNFFPNSEILIDSCTFFRNESLPGSNMGGAGGGLWIQNIENPISGMGSGLSAMITNCTFERNTGNAAAGAGFDSLSDSLNILISNSDFIENVSGGVAGGLLLGNTFSRLDRNTFIGNSSETSIGGGFFMYANGQNNEKGCFSEIRNCDFLNNKAFAGAGLACNNFYIDTQLTIDSCTFSENNNPTTMPGFGAAMIIQNIESTTTAYSSLMVDVNNSIIENNSIEQGAGGYFYSESDTMQVKFADTEFTGNTSSGEGSGVYILGATYLDFSMQRMKFSENISNNNGGTIDIDGANPHVRLENSLMIDNQGLSAIFNVGDLFLQGNTFVDNFVGLYQIAAGNAEIQNSVFSNNINYFSTGVPTVTSKGGNISSDETFESDFTGFGNYADYNETDPQLDMNFVPGETSVAIDAGNPDGVTALTDLAGVDRIQGSQIDIGAFESPFLVATENLNTLNIEIYPNPFVDYLRISNIEGIKSIRLLDVLGRVIQEFSVQNELKITGNLSEGIYFLELAIDGKKYLKKVKQNR